ncbi:hypothetical protein HOU79_gp01 [Vibrio phage 1.224.A._10N.261.48.B1]|uniref:Uncharacterized protein n=2 Tax=Mukerjeevirus TaxID=2733146 RepID=A0A2I7REH2_9CAUD|nr:hypothetical protein HOU76_gp67 [Vibrio phage 1.169.O._10N.261.52.B1]YP_009817601.1 hypothetical protein HOU79_gp01 [Vibrio phage 1.224.A._10N.261.48.B1]AUR92060.1 hypothetical protein NVP1169O_32 [Vibrio phage 1.169.O._10N.261.52.B1]AUR96368.1 hypothetical protein NVP1224A_01 [Vibrio phage 1.224.A._10N.261.48.B1]
MSTLKETLGTTISTTLSTLNDAVPLAGVTVTTGLVAVNSWLVEMVNEDANMDTVNMLKAQMTSGLSKAELIKKLQAETKKS